MLENPSIKYGVYAGVALIVIDLLLSFISENAFITWGSWIGLIIIIPAMVMAGTAYLNANGGYATFGEIFKASWLSYLITGLISTAFFYVLVNFISPSILDTMMEKSMEAMEKLGGLLGEEGLEKAKEQIEKSNPGSVTVNIVNLITKYFFAAIAAAIIALILRKEKSEFA